MGQIDPNRIRKLANHTLEKALAKGSTEPLSLESLANASLTEAPVGDSSGALRMTLSFTIQNSPSPQVVAAQTDRSCRASVSHMDMYMYRFRL